MFKPRLISHITAGRSQLEAGADARFSIFFFGKVTKVVGHGASSQTDVGGKNVRRRGLSDTSRAALTVLIGKEVQQ